MSGLNWATMEDLAPKNEYDGSHLYTRIGNGLKEDALVGMFSDYVTQRLALAIMQRVCRNSDQWTLGTNPDSMPTYIRDVVKMSPMAGVLSSEFLDHLVGVVLRSVFPATFRETGA